MPAVATASKWSVRKGTKWGIDGWLVFAPDTWANHLTPTFDEAIHYAHLQAQEEKEYS